MRTRTVLSITAAAIISLGLAFPASAAQLIRYRGETSAPSNNSVNAYVVKRDSGRRFLLLIAIDSTLTCEDATTQQIGAVIRIGRLVRLADDGSFSREIKEENLYLRVDGTIGFRDGSGTFLYNRATLTEDGSDAQLCTTGDLTWTVERMSAKPARSSPVHVTPGSLRVRVVGNR